MSRIDPMRDVLHAFEQDLPTDERLQQQSDEAVAEGLVTEHELDDVARRMRSAVALQDPSIESPRNPHRWGWRAGLALAAAALFAVLLQSSDPIEAGSNEAMAVAPSLPVETLLVAGPGLTLSENARVTQVRNVAVLHHGGLTFERHDELVPPVNRVQWGAIPLVAVPVGTVFEAQAIGDSGLVSVQQGVVALEHQDGTELGLLEAGDTSIVRYTGAGLHHIDVAGWTLDRISDLGTDGPSLAAAVAQLRLNAVNRPLSDVIQQVATE